MRACTHTPRERASEQGKEKTKAAASKADATALAWSLDAARLTELLGAPKYRAEKPQPIIEPGLAHGLAWTSLGGTTLHIETARYPGKGQLKLTGQLGEVMRDLRDEDDEDDEDEGPEDDPTPPPQGEAQKCLRLKELASLPP